MTCKENVEKIVKNKCRILQPFYPNLINIFMSYKRLEIMKIAVIYDFRITLINLKILARNLPMAVACFCISRFR